MSQEEIEQYKKAMRDAAMSGVGQYIEAGQHHLEISMVKHQKTVIDGAFKESYIAEFKVVSSNNPSHEVGSTRSYVENTKNAGSSGRFQTFLLAACGCDPNMPVTPQWRDYVADLMAALRYDEYRVSKGIPEMCGLKGKFVLCEGMDGKSKGKGTPITHKKWWPAQAPAAT